MIHYYFLNNLWIIKIKIKIKIKNKNKNKKYCISGMIIHTCYLLLTTKYLFDNEIFYFSK
jgi:hypothetical protein